MIAKCHVCSLTAIVVNKEGNWVCEQHQKEVPQQKFDIQEIVKELRQYITLQDLDKIVEARKKLDAMDIDYILSETNEKTSKIIHAKNKLNEEILALEEIIEIQKRAIIPKSINIIKLGNKEINTLGKHRCYPQLLTYIVNKKDVFLNGPAGAGKNTAVEQAALELSMPLHVLQLSQLSLKSELTGYRNIVNDNFISTTFANAYEQGGIFFADEFDNWAPSVVTSVNMAIANGFYEFPKGTIRRHKDFVFIAAGNTIGLGADSHYITSRALSAASRDRFRFLQWPIDEDLEFLMVPNEFKYWVEFVQECRKLCNQNGGNILITPRASIQGAEDLAMGFSRKDVVKNVLLRNVETPSYLQNNINIFTS